MARREDDEGPVERRRRPLPDRPRRRPRDEDYDEDDYYDDRPDPIATFIPYKNPKSLVAYYTGVFSLIPILGLALGPVALVFGILALRYRRENPTAGGTGHAITGVVLGSLTLLANWGTVLVVGLLLAFGK